MAEAHELLYVQGDIPVEAKGLMLAGGAVSKENRLLILACFTKASDAGFGLEGLEINPIDAGVIQEPCRFFRKMVDEGFIASFMHGLP